MKHSHPTIYFVRIDKNGNTQYQNACEKRTPDMMKRYRDRGWVEVATGEVTEKRLEEKHVS
jgi:hypothetical protein